MRTVIIAAFLALTACATTLRQPQNTRNAQSADAQRLHDEILDAGDQLRPSGRSGRPASHVGARR